jgi:Protein of unknown function (DUF3089)
MKRTLLLALLLLVLAPVTLLAAMSMMGEQMTSMLLQPDHRRSDDPITVPPDYKDDRYWASIPTDKGLANLVPEGQQTRRVPAEVAVFYIHPTSYLSSARWNAPLFENNWAWEVVDVMMASQASAFNACCEVYAPHYREATLWSFMERNNQDGLRALEIAYMDVSRAFDNFISSRSQGRPFIIASHSQGTAHALRLLSEKINNTNLRERLVSAYLVGYHLPMDTFERELTNIPPCETPFDTGCVIHWATYGDQGKPDSGVPHWYSSGWEYSEGKEVLCTNPISWQTNEQLVPASDHPGALDVEMDYGLLSLMFNRPSGAKITALSAVMPEWTWAQCRDGVLHIEPQLEGPFVSSRDDENQNYHTRDYALFYQSVRENAVLRAESVRPSHLQDFSQFD